MSTVLYDSSALAARSRVLGSLNGIDFGVMQLDSASPPQYGVLELHFFNDNHLDDLVAAAASPGASTTLLPITGGDRILAGALSGQVQVTKIVHTGSQVLAVTLAPVGDYSRYTLTIDSPGATPWIDPIFSQFIFRFRPGCFSSNCTPAPSYAAAVVEPAIDYLAKDYASFRHTIIAAMMQRVPGWQPTSEASLDVVLLDLFSAAADELSNYQDRVMQEAYWTTATKRISLRRHARLMDYAINEGNQASTVLALNFPGTAQYLVPDTASFAVAGQPPMMAWSGANPAASTSVAFVTSGAQTVSGLFSSVSLYTWSDAIPSLAMGATQADLAFPTVAAAQLAQTLIANGSIPRLLIEEWLNPATGMAADRNPQKRQILRLTGATLLTDPLTNDPVVRVTWQPQDGLLFPYCFVVFLNGVRVPGVSLFHGNLLNMVQGTPQTFYYVAPGVPLTTSTYHFQINAAGAAECRLPPAFPVLWTKTTPGGYENSVSTVSITSTDASGTMRWAEQPDLIHSESSDRHFVVETDESLRTLVRFGDGTNGMELPDDATVTINWLSGYGPDGNIGQDSIVNLTAPGMPNLSLGTVWNPLDVTDGLAPESPDVIRRRVPEAFLYQQSRAVTLADYVARAEEVAGVAQAAAFYQWTGSWRTVRVVVDPEGTTTLSAALRSAVEQQVDAVHLIGEDVEVRAPDYVPLTITVVVCLSSEFWIDDVSPEIDEAFANGYTSSGAMAFFHPDNWSFGQSLYASQIEGVLAGIPGVEHVVSIEMARWWNQSVQSGTMIAIAPQEIVLVSNDPSRLEEGTITFSYQGGRQ